MLSDSAVNVVLDVSDLPMLLQVAASRAKGDFFCSSSYKKTKEVIVNKINSSESSQFLRVRYKYFLDKNSKVFQY